jgi:hypothetical protein
MRPSQLLRIAALASALFSLDGARASAQEAPAEAPAEEPSTPVTQDTPAQEASASEAPEAPPPGRPPAQDPDRWVLQWSGRLGQGFGSLLGSLKHKFANEVTIRSEFLFGRPGDRHVRIGPALEIRSVNFGTIEYSGGGMLLIPTHPGWPLQISALAGYAHRWKRVGPDPQHGPVFVATAAYGYRSYNYHGRYGFGINLYASTHVHLDNPSAYEITGGFEFDILLAAVVPAMMIRMAVTREDPDEPGSDEDDEEVEDAAEPAPQR